jgi:methionine synthase II (cobalamin-independent)
MSGDTGPLLSTGIGSWPGIDLSEALKVSFAECPRLPYLPELPHRGAYAQLVGRTTAWLAGLAVDLQPAGWRLTDASGRDHRQAKSTVRSDLDQLEEVAQGYAGRFKVAACGPWTLAASMERPRGDRVLADFGARRDVAQSLAEGLAEVMAELQRRLPDLELVLQLDEPLLPPVLAGSVPTASGFSRHRVVDPPELSEAVGGIVDRLAAAGLTVPVVVHCCAPGLPIELIRRAGVAGVSVDLDHLTTVDWDVLAPALEDGFWLGAGALPTDRPMSPDEVAARVLRPLRGLGLEPSAATRTVLTPACGLAGLSVEAATQALRTVRSAAVIVTDELAA